MTGTVIPVDLPLRVGFPKLDILPWCTTVELLFSTFGVGTPRKLRKFAPPGKFALRCSYSREVECLFTPSPF